MSGQVTIVPATRAHAEQLAPLMRPADAAEVKASGGYEPLDALLDAMSWSAEAYAGFIDGELACLFGVVPGTFLTGEAVPWLLTSGVVQRNPRAFLRASRGVIAGWLEQYPVLVQQVDARYDAALRWAARVGFEVEPPAPFGVGGEPFCRISMRRT
jgi:hypothetical protein